MRKFQEKIQVPVWLGMSHATERRNNGSFVASLCIFPVFIWSCQSLRSTIWGGQTITHRSLYGWMDGLHCPLGWYLRVFSKVSAKLNELWCILYQRAESCTLHTMCCMWATQKWHKMAIHLEPPWSEQIF